MLRPHQSGYLLLCVILAGAYQVSAAETQNPSPIPLQAASVTEHILPERIRKLEFRDLHFSPDGRFIIAIEPPRQKQRYYDGGFFSCWELSSQRELWSTANLRGTCHVVQMSDQGDAVILRQDHWYDHTVKDNDGAPLLRPSKTWIVDLATGKPFERFAGFPSAFTGPARISASGSLVGFVSDDGKLNIWDRKSRPRWISTPLRAPKKAENSFYGVKAIELAFAADDKRVAIITEGGSSYSKRYWLGVFDIPGQKLTGSWRGNLVEGPIIFSPTRQEIATRGFPPDFEIPDPIVDGNTFTGPEGYYFSQFHYVANIWSTRTPKRVAVMQGSQNPHTAWYEPLAFSLDGKYLLARDDATATDDWDSADLHFGDALTGTIKHHYGGIKGRQLKVIRHDQLTTYTINDGVVTLRQYRIPWPKTSSDKRKVPGR